MTTKELADELKVSEKNLRAKAALMGLHPHRELNEQEEQVLRKLAHLKNERIKGIRQGLKESSLNEILKELDTETSNSTYSNVESPKIKKSKSYSQERNSDIDEKLNDLQSQLKKGLKELEKKTSILIKQHFNAPDGQKANTDHILSKISDLKTEINNIKQQFGDPERQKTDTEHILSKIADLQKGVTHFIQQRDKAIEEKFQKKNDEIDVQLRKAEENSLTYVKDYVAAEVLPKIDTGKLFAQLDSLKKELSGSMKLQENSISEKIDAVKDEFGENLKTVENDIISYIELYTEEQAGKKLARAEDRVKVLEQETDRLQKQIQKLIRIQEKTGSQIAQLTANKENSIHQSLVNRISGITGEGKKKRAPVALRLKEENVILEKLKGVGLVYPLSIIQELRHYVGIGDVLLVGPPGTGKSTLLKNINVLFENEDKLNTTPGKVTPEWTSYEILGGKCFQESTLSVSIGIFTKALIECLETGFPTILTLDELNRSKPDDFLGGIMDCIARNHSQHNYAGSLHFHELSLLVPTVDSLEIPPNFRTICAMNESDTRYLFPVSESIQKRFNKVDLSKIDRDLEREALEKYVSEIESPLNKEIVVQIETFLEIVHALRGHDADINESRCLFGTFYANNVIDELVSIRRSSKNGIDATLKKIIIPLYQVLDSNERDRIVEEVLQPFGLTECANVLKIV